MSGTNDFQTVAAAPGANVVTQAQYLALTSLLADGLTSGIVASDQLNKILRQGSIMSAVIGQLIADSTGQNATDDGTIATLESNLAAVIRGAAITAPDTGTANAYAITLSPAPIALTPGMLVQIDNIVGTNSGASTLNVNGLEVLPIHFSGGIALQGGELLAKKDALLRLNHAMSAWELIWTGAGEFVPPAAQNNAAVQAGQLIGALGVSAAAAANSTGVNVTTASFTAPCNGKALVFGFAGSSQIINSISSSSTLSGYYQLAATAMEYSGVVYGELPMNTGQSSTFTIAVGTTTSGTVTCSIWTIWVPEPLGGN